MKGIGNVSRNCKGVLRQNDDGRRFQGRSRRGQGNSRDRQDHGDEKYSFTKDDLNKVVGEVVGHKLEDGELEKLVCGFYEEQMASGNPDACKVVVEWIRNLK